MHPAIVPGNVAVVTGAANGIGEAAARRFAAAGRRVCLADFDAERLARVQADLGDQAIAVTLDVSDRAAVEALAAEVAELRAGSRAVEERARYDLGMVRPGEIFVQINETPTRMPSLSGEVRTAATRLE